eukprot:scaffold34318_cov32-Tisochrysis_lutea.AAC.3
MYLKHAVDQLAIGESGRARRWSRSADRLLLERKRHNIPSAQLLKPVGQHIGVHQSRGEPACTRRSARHPPLLVLQATLSSHTFVAGLACAHQRSVYSNPPAAQPAIGNYLRLSLGAPPLRIAPTVRLLA